MNAEEAEEDLESNDELLRTTCLGKLVLRLLTQWTLLNLRSYCNLCFLHIVTTFIILHLNGGIW